MLNKWIVVCMAGSGIALSGHAQPLIGLQGGAHRTFTNASPGDQVPEGFPEPDVIDGWGFHGGAYLELDLGPRFFLRPELGYGLRDHRYEAAYDTTIFFQGLPITARAEVEVRVRRAYLELPVLLGIKAGKNLSFVAGPAACWLLSSNSETDGSFKVGTFFQGLELPLRTSSSSTDGLNALLPMAVAGIDYRSDGGVSVGLRYWHGLRALEENTDAIVTRQHLLRLCVGYAFLGRAARSGTVLGE